MPEEIRDIERFSDLSKKSKHCLVKRLGGCVKLKLRTEKTLYTLKIDSSMAEEVMKKLRCEIMEI